MEIRKVGVLGCGLMGSGIAQVAATAGFETIVKEVSDDLIARGFGWGWQPHWMALDLNRLPRPDPRHSIDIGHREIPDAVPYGGDPDAPPAVHVSIAVDGRIAGHAAMNPWRGVAGIYSMGVSPAHRRGGIGRALTIAACRIAAERGCSHATLNATGRRAS